MRVLWSSNAPRVLEALDGAWPVVYSRWGQEMLGATGLGGDGLVRWQT